MAKLRQSSRMTPTEFYSTVLALWGEEWRPELDRFLRKRGLSYSRQSFWNWRQGAYPVPLNVSELLQAEAAGRRS